MAIAKNNINENANGVNLKVGIFGRGGWLAAKIGQNKHIYKMLAYPLKVRDLRYRYADGKLTRQIKVSIIRLLPHERKDWQNSASRR